MGNFDNGMWNWIEFDRFMIDYINQVIRFVQNSWIKVISGHLFELNRSFMD